MTKFQNKYRIESSRLKSWDYSTPWWYYVTINTKNHFEYFGRIERGYVLLNELGLITKNCWENIPEHFPNIELDYFIIMPNHLHGIIIINPIVETPDRATLPQKTTLGQIINQFKGSVKRWANKNNYSNFSWQSRFYDHIIRNEKELYNIRKYIEQNPLKWNLEKNKTENNYL
jgi:REP element-mobilizing transposase RayT